jgi:hypothetical protein
VVEEPTPSVLVIIQADPLKSARAVEALRIALGLGSHNEGKDLQIILSGRAPHLLAEDSSEVVDSEILEKHLPVFVEWETTFLTAPGADAPPRWLPECKVEAATAEELAGAVRSAKKVLIF